MVIEQEALDIRQISENSKLFGMLDEEGQQRLLALGVQADIPDGTVLFEEGETGSTFFIVLEGTLRVLIDKGHKKEEVARLQPGACVGEIAALMHEERSATVETCGVVNALQFDANPVKDLLADYPHVREALVKQALERSEENLQELLRVTMESGTLENMEEID